MNTPRGACDCHMHVYDARFQALPNAILRIAPASAYMEMARSLGLERMVVVQPSGYGFDNACTLDAMAQFGACARAVVVIPADTPRAELQRLHGLGVRGVRFMMLAPGGLSWEAMPAMAEAVGPLGWHLNLQFDGHELPSRINALSALPADVVIDHFGSYRGGVTAGDPAFRALLRWMESGRVWVKLSAPYAYGISPRGGPDYEEMAPLARALTRAQPERCLWASNWPHPTETAPPTDAAMLALLERWAPDEQTRERMLVGNPARLYGFTP
jgi:D-galactarolactone isomerase